MQCRKCGAKNITRRRAGVFVCQRCGVQPGPACMDRAGNGDAAPLPVDLTQDVGAYAFAVRQPRLTAIPPKAD